MPAPTATGLPMSFCPPRPDLAGSRFSRAGLLQYGVLLPRFLLQPSPLFLSSFHVSLLSSFTSLPHHPSLSLSIYSKPFDSHNGSPPTPSPRLPAAYTTDLRAKSSPRPPNALTSPFTHISPSSARQKDQSPNHLPPVSRPIPFQYPATLTLQLPSSLVVPFALHAVYSDYTLYILNTFSVLN